MSEWISVDDDLPDAYEEVFIWPTIDHYGEKLTAWITAQGDWLYNLQTENLACDEKVDHEITHWQLMFEPPQDKE